MGLTGTIYNYARLYRTIQIHWTMRDHTGPYGTIRNHMGPYGKIGDHKDPYRTIQDTTGPKGTLWHLMATHRTIWLIFTRTVTPLEKFRWFPQIVFTLLTSVTPINVGFSNCFFC